jgi:hypothetical protein
VVVSVIIPRPELWTAGEEVDAETMTRRSSQMLEFLLEPPQAYARQVTAQTGIPSGSWTKVNLDTVDKDNDGIWDGTNKRFVIQTPGWYEVYLGVGYYWGTTVAASARGRRIASIRLNGVTVNGGLRGRRDTIPDRTSMRTCRTGGSMHAIFLNKDDYIELMTWHDAGEALQTSPGEQNGQPFLQVVWVSN